MQINEEDFIDYVVNKPWGYEYLAFQNKNLAIWVLHISHMQSTSLHCHSKKLTGLICLDGKVEVSFINNKQILNPMDKVMIRPTLFHSSKSISKEGSTIIEIETPVDKDDLIRLKDFYGRENQKYESKDKYRIRNEKDLWICEGKKNELSNCNFLFYNPDNKEDLLKFENSIFIILEGSFINKRDGKTFEIAPAGTCMYSSVYKEILPSITELSRCKLLILESK